MALHGFNMNDNFTFEELREISALMQNYFMERDGVDMPNESFICGKFIGKVLKLNTDLRAAGKTQAEINEMKFDISEKIDG